MSMEVALPVAFFVMLFFVLISLAPAPGGKLENFHCGLGKLLYRPIFSSILASSTNDLSKNIAAQQKDEEQKLKLRSDAQKNNEKFEECIKIVMLNDHDLKVYSV